MLNEKLKALQIVLQQEVDFAWQCKMGTSVYNQNNRSFGSYLESSLNAHNKEISQILDDIAREQTQNQEPPNFNNYIRYSTSSMTHKEVFVGDKWILVPNTACVDFRTTTLGGSRAFTVTVSNGSDYATFTSTESLQSYQQNQQLLEADPIHLELQNDYVSKEEYDWMLLASQVYGTTKKNISGLGDLAELYSRTPKEFKRHYAYKISKVAKSIGKPAKAGKIFHGAEKVMKKAGKVAKVGPYLSAGTIIYEVGDAYINDTEIKPHTYVDGTLLVVGIAATAVGAPAVVVGLAIYGILDYAFNISEGIDNTFGSDSDLWNNKPIKHFPKKTTPIFNDVKIDNTYVAPNIKLPPNFKN